MIHINDESKCCGCMSCVQICPKQCITTKESKKGFLYPFVDETSCIKCNLCEKVCPVNAETYESEPIVTLAAKHESDEIRFISSSGGVFSSLAEQVIKEGGIVFGAMFDTKWNVFHGSIDSLENICKLRGSKYVQSYIGDSYKKVLEQLENGRFVLFSGTSCQIAGLKKFLRKNYVNLITVDVICHGSPSPGVWRDYLKCHKEQFEQNNVKITNISFRDKTNGWRKYSFVIKGYVNSHQDEKSLLIDKETVLLSEPAGKNIYLRSFIDNYTLRPSCYNCESKGGKSMSDITLADCWGIWKYHEKFYDDKGVSAILVNTDKGLDFIKKTNINNVEIEFSQVLEFNKSFSQSVKRPRFYKLFWLLYPFFKIKALHIVYFFRPRYVINKLLNR